LAPVPFCSKEVVLAVEDEISAEGRPKFSPIKTILRYQSIVDQIMDLIKSGSLQIGEKFPSERELSEKWQVSRPVLREAFRVLESQGIVKSRHGAGRFVRSDRVIDVGEIRRDHLRDRRQSLLQNWEVRSLLEVRAAELAAREARDEQIDAIERPIAMIESMSADESRQTDMNMEIHTAIADASGNPYLAEMILRALEDYRSLNFKEAVPLDEWKSLQDEHRPIVDAIRARSPERARKEMEIHFEGLSKALQKWSGD
jgi:GntR family transcriptional repressor for pyruvate dehydrogenase complex